MDELVCTNRIHHDESHYEHIKECSKSIPFKNSDELINHYCKNIIHNDSNMPPLIWIKHKHTKTIYLICFFDENKIGTKIGSYTMEELAEHFVFLDNSPCGL